MKKLLLPLLFIIPSMNLSAQWTSYPLPSTNIDMGQEIYFISSNIGFITGYQIVPSSHLNGFIYRTTNGGANWTLVKSLTGTTASFPYKSFSLDAMHFVNSNVGFCVGENWVHGFVCKTVDGGLTWDTLSLTASGITSHLLDVYFTDVNTGFSVSQDGEIFKTTDGGNLWTEVHYISGAPEINDVTFVNSTTGFAVTFMISNQAYILKTTDSGNTWNVVHTSNNQNITSISMVNSTTGFALSLGGILYKTTDGGNTWSESTISGLNSSWEVHFVSPTTGFASGLSGFSRVIKKTTDGGATWTTDYTDFEINSFYNYSFIGSTAYAISPIDFLKTPSAPTAVEENYLAVLIDIYPNPAGNILKLDFPVETEISNVKIYDPSSKLVINESNEFSQINIENLAKGIYLLNIENDEQVIYSTKFIKQ